MTLSKDFVLRQVVDTWVVLPLKSDTLDFTGMIRLNGSGMMIWKRLEQGAERVDLVQALTDRYNVTPEQAGNDVDEFLGTLRNAGCLID